MDWTAGYASDVLYTAGFYREQSPVHLNFVAALNGYEPVPLDRPYHYFELGFGRGLTANVLAAANPNGRFYAADFNAAHVAGARALAGAAALDNLVLLENSFAELAQGAVADLPQFDFITLHGIYTWITAENQRHIVEFIARHLKPGGIVYLSYNAMPGWAGALPLQRLLVEYGDAFPGRSDTQINGAAGFVDKLVKASAAAFNGGTVLQQRLDVLKTANRNYLVHEYMHKHWKPLYHADVARDLADAKLDYAGSAELPLAYPTLYLNEERQALVDHVPEPAVRETLVDYFMNTTFRKDVFIRGARRLTGLRRSVWMERTGAVLLKPRAAASIKMALTIGEVNGVPDIFNPVFDALAERPHTLAELTRLPALAAFPFENVIQTVALLWTSDQVGLYDGGGPGSDTAPAHRLNRALAAEARFGDDYQVLCSPLLGTGVAASFVERLVYLLLTQGAPAEPQALTRHAWQLMVLQNRSMARDGVALVGDEANLAELQPTVTDVLNLSLPLWRKLKVI